jgi:hypothetical protein
MKCLTNGRLWSRVFAVVVAFLILLSLFQSHVARSVFATATTNSFDGRYVPDASRGSGNGLLTVPPCLGTESIALGQGMEVTNSIATFWVGIQPVGALKIKPSKISGNVDSNGKLDMSKKMVRVTGEFDGPANGKLDHQNRFNGTLTIIINSKKSCGYSLSLIHAPE